MNMGDNIEAVLKSYVNRIEDLETDKAAVVSEIKDVYTEVKSAGLDPTIVRMIIRERKMGAAERAERESLLEIYRKALGMLGDTPLGEAALRRAAANPLVSKAVKRFVDSAVLPAEAAE